MHTFINSPLQIGSLKLAHRLIQSPMAGYSCSPFRSLFYQYRAPAYCVSEMSSAIDIVNKHSEHSRYLHRSPVEKILAYQISGFCPDIMAQAALKLELMGADLIDINCGCPKTKIRKKGSGSALLEKPQLLIQIIQSVRSRISIPLTVKIRLQTQELDCSLAKQLEAAGADALIVHGRRWTDDYDIPCNLQAIRHIKNCIRIPVIANGDISDLRSLQQAMDISSCDGYMIGRAATGRPFLYQELLEQQTIHISSTQKMELFLTHLDGLAALESEYQALLQSRSLCRYYFKNDLTALKLQQINTITSLEHIQEFLEIEMS